MNTLDLKALHKAGVTLLLTIAFFYAIDFVVREWNPVKGYTSWGNPNIDDKVSLLESFVKKYGRVDLITVGSSVGQGLDVGQWQRETKDDFLCFNFNIPGLRAECTEFLMRNYLVPKYHPKKFLYTAHPEFIFHGELTQEREAYPEFWNSTKVKALDAKSLEDKCRSLLICHHIFRKPKAILELP